MYGNEGYMGTTQDRLPRHFPPSASASATSLPSSDLFDGKRVRKAVHRRTVDYTSTVVRFNQLRIWQRDRRDASFLQPTPLAAIDMLPTAASADNPSTSISTKFVHASTNKVRCSINRVLWTPTGRRLITGSQSGEFTLWNGQSFNFEMILQAHDEAIRSMVWSHNENWMVTGDDGGCIKYWQTNMNNVKANKAAHKEAVRDLSFSSTDLKFCSCSDDTTVKVWDFARCQEERSLAGHGWDVKSVDWHPQKSLLVSGAKDNLVKLWDAKTGRELYTLHGHKNIVLSVKWNSNGNWVLTASKDQIIKLYDIRTLKELETYRGHRKDVTCLAWHPFHEELFVSGSYDGIMMFWIVGHEVPQAEVLNAHENSVWDLAWHPMGHILCSGSNDHTTKFWCRNRPGDTIREKPGVSHLQCHWQAGIGSEQKLHIPGRPATSIQAAEGPATPGPFIPGGPVRGDGTIPGVGVAMPLAQPTVDNRGTEESSQQLMLGSIASGSISRGPHPPALPHPSALSSVQPLYPQQLHLQQFQQPQPTPQPQQLLAQHQQQLPLPPLPPLPPPPQQHPLPVIAVSSVAGMSSISVSDPLLPRPGMSPSSAQLLMSGHINSVASMSGPSPPARPQIGPLPPTLGVPGPRVLSGGQLPIPLQGPGLGNETLGVGGMYNNQLSFSGGQSFSGNISVHSRLPGLMGPLNGTTYHGISGPPLVTPISTGPVAFQGNIPNMMDVRPIPMNVGLQMGMGLGVPPHTGLPPPSQGPGPPQL